MAKVKITPQTTGNVPLLLLSLILFCVIGFFCHRFHHIDLQLPVEDGHEGGRVLVRHRSEEYLFDLAESCSRCLYPTASYSDCALDLEEVTLGSRLAIVICLTLVDPLLAAPPELPNPLAHQKLTKILAKWAQLPSQVKYLVIPFRHQYDPDVYLDFNGLKGRDKSWFQTNVAFPVEVRIVLIRKEAPVGYTVALSGILIWPKGQLMDTSLLSDFLDELDLLENQPGLATLHQVIDFCVRHPVRARSEVDDRSNRLFALCLQLEAGGEGLRLLSIFSSNVFSDAEVTAGELAIAISRILIIVDLETCSGVFEVASGELDQEFTEKFDNLATALLEVDQIEYGQYLTLKVATRGIHLEMLITVC